MGNAKIKEILMIKKSEMSQVYFADRVILAKCSGDNYTDIHRRRGWVHIGGDTIFSIVRGGMVVYDHRTPSNLRWSIPPTQIYS